MTFLLGRQSRNELVGVHQDLVRVVERAIELTPQDFVVFDGLRTLDEQKAYVAAGASKTLNSRHLPGQDGKGHAVDLVPIINNKARWEWGAIIPIAEAMRTASRELGVPLNWGGIKGTRGFGRLDTAGGSLAKLRNGWDGVHFELPRIAGYL